MTKKVPKSTQKYRKILKITHKYPKLPKSTKTYINIREDHRFFLTKVAKNTQNDQKSTQKYSKVQTKDSTLLISTLKYQKVPKSTQKYIKVKGTIGFFSHKSSQKYSK